MIADIEKVAVEHVNELLGLHRLDVSSSSKGLFVTRDDDHASDRIIGFET
jgi:hypothetical protein